MSMSGVTFERLPPERRIAAPSAASAGSCCCCCCCCLHTVGSLIGALSAKVPQPPVETVPTAVVGTDNAAPNYRIAKEYWVTVLILTTVVLPVVLVVLADADVNDDFGVWALLAAMVFPGVQLAASVVVALRNHFFSKRPGEKERMNHLAIITGRAFLGAMIGVLVMVFFGVFLLR